MIATEVQPFAEVIGPYLPLLGTIFGGLIVGGFTVWNRRRGAVEMRQPTPNEFWAEERSLRKELKELQQAFDELRGLFRSYVERIQRGGNRTLSSPEKAALNLPDDCPDILPTEHH